jgi:hypothetical protein
MVIQGLDIGALERQPVTVGLQFWNMPAIYSPSGNIPASGVAMPAAGIHFLQFGNQNQLPTCHKCVPDRHWNIASFVYAETQEKAVEGESRRADP